MTDEQKSKYYHALENGQKPAIIGKALVQNEWKEVEYIDESNIDSLERVRVIWRDDQNRRVTSFVAPKSIISPLPGKWIMKAKYTQNPFTGVYVGFIEETPGVCAQGNTLEELQAVLIKNNNAYRKTIGHDDSLPVQLEFEKVELKRSTFRSRFFQKLMTIIDIIFAYRLEVTVWNEKGDQASKHRLL